MRSRVVAVDAAAEHGDGRAARVQRAAVRLAVDAARQAADDDEACRSQLAGKRTRDLATVRRAAAGADDRNGRPRQQLDLAAADVEPFRRIVHLCEEGRVAGVTPANDRYRHVSSSAGER